MQNKESEKVLNQPLKNVELSHEKYNQDGKDEVFSDGFSVLQLGNHSLIITKKISFVKIFLSLKLGMCACSHITYNFRLIQYLLGKNPSCFC